MVGGIRLSGYSCGEFACNTLGNIAKNLHFFFEEFPTAKALSGDLFLEEDLITLKRTTSAVTEELKLAVNETLSNMDDCGVPIQPTELDELHNRIENLQDEWQTQQEHMGRMQAEMYKLRRQLSHQSSFCASLGAILGQMLWKGSQMGIVVEKMLSGNKVGDFFCIVEGTLSSFLETYKGTMPAPNSDERQFLMSMCGVVTNIAAVPQGREYLCVNPNGVTLIQAILAAIPNVPMPSGRELKRLLIMVMYNVSINKSGQVMMQTHQALSVIGSCINVTTPPDLILISLRVAQSVTYSIPSTEIYQVISSVLPISSIQELSTSEDPEIKEQATAVLANIRKAGDEIKASGGAAAGAGGANTGLLYYCTKQCN